MADKRAERLILELIYDPADFETVLDSEAPDFVLRRAAAASSFGVEVTELYYSESAARLDNIAGYGRHLLEGGDFVHRDDAIQLRVGDARLYSPDGVLRSQTKAIIYSLPPIQDYPAMVLTTIADKNRKAAAYPAALTHCNLIIRDTGSRLVGLSPDAATSLLLTFEVREALIRSPFHEVFLITSLAAGQTTYFPLRRLVLIAEFYMLEGCLQSLGGAEVFTQEHVIKLYSRYLRWMGAHVGIAIEPDGSAQVVLGRCGLRLSADTMDVLDYRDYPLPTNILAVETATPLADELRLFEAVSAFGRDHAFGSDIVFHARAS